MSEAVALALLEVEGKLYLNAAEWPIKVYADRVAVKTFDPRRVTWDGQNLKLWLENGNAVYTLAPDDDGKDDIVTLHRKVASDVGAVPGHPAPEPAAPEPIVVSTSALEAVGFQRVMPPALVDQIITPATSNIFARALSDAKGMGDYGGRTYPTNVTHPISYSGAFTTGNPTPYRDLHHLQREVDAMRSKLVSTMEMVNTQYLMESPTGMPLALDSSRSQWRTFLTDIGGYLNFVQGMCQKLATMSYLNAKGEESRVWLTEPLAAQGRLSEFERSYQFNRQPKEVTIKEMMGEMGRTAEMLGGQATTLLGIVAPSPAVETGEASVDSPLTNTADYAPEFLQHAEPCPVEFTSGGNGQMGGDDGG